MLSLPWRGLMEAVLSKLCRFIRGLVSDNFELSVIEKHPHTNIRTYIQISECTHTHSAYTRCAHIDYYTRANLFKTPNTQR